MDLLPAGVTVVVESNYAPEDKQKNVVVAGSPEKGYKAYFAATDSEHGEELWCTDGTPEGTYMVKDIVPGTGSSNPSYLGRLNDKVLFSAYTDMYGFETWVSDGTEEGTFMLVETYILGDGDPKAFFQMNETQAIFIAVDDESAEYDPVGGKQYWLWITDGTTEGTHRVVGENTDEYYLEHQANCVYPGKDRETRHGTYMRVGRRMFFKADDVNSMIGEELWVTDGTAEGTYLVMDINWEKGTQEGQTCSCGVDNFFNYNNEKLLFAAWTPLTGTEPWVTDGTKGEANTEEHEVEQGWPGDEHTYMVYDTHPGTDPSTGVGYSANIFAVGFEVYKDRAWWRGYSPEYGYEFAGSNLEKGDYVVFDIDKIEPTAEHHSYPDPGCIFDGVYMFCATTEHDTSLPDICFGGELWYYDGEGVQMQSDFVPGTLSNWVKEQVVAGGSMYWHNETNGEWDLGYGTGLYRLDSKDESPVVCNLIDETASTTGDEVHTIRNLNGTVLYCADVNSRIYSYNYTKPGWDGVSDFGYMEPDFGDSDANAIQNVASGEKVVKKGVYTLNGTKVANTTKNLPKGIYIVDGKKRVVK